MINFSVEFSKALKNKMYVLILNMHHKCMIVHVHIFAFCFYFRNDFGFLKLFVNEICFGFFCVYFMNLKTLFQVK